MSYVVYPGSWVPYYDAGNPIRVIGRQAEDRFDQSRPYITRIYRLTFGMTTTTPLLGPLAAREMFKSYTGFCIGAYYNVSADSYQEYDKLSFCTSILARSSSADGCEWIIDVTFEPIDPQQIANYENPLDAPFEASWDGQNYQKIADVAHLADGSPTLVLNSACDPFDPPVQRDDSRYVLSCRWNMAMYGSGQGAEFNDGVIETYRDAVNSVAWLGRTARKWKCGPLRASLAWHPSLYDPDASLSGYYWQIEAHFELNADTWDFKVLDQGYRTTNYTTLAREQIIIDGVPTTSPVLLDGTGGQQAVNSDGTITPVYLTYRVYPEVDFAAAFGFGG